MRRCRIGLTEDFLGHLPPPDRTCLLLAQTGLPSLDYALVRWADAEGEHFECIVPSSALVMPGGSPS